MIQDSLGEQATKGPIVIENREFVGYEEEDIQRLNKQEAAKFAHNPEISQAMEAVELELNNTGHWEEHWLTLDSSGRRTYARIYYGDDRAMAVTADGKIIKKLNFSS